MQLVLPLVEGCTVSTRYGMLKTDHILFIASGAFHLSKPSDLIPELQGRLPIRVELRALDADDFPNSEIVNRSQKYDIVVACLKMNSLLCVNESLTLKRLGLFKQILPARKEHRQKLQQRHIRDGKIIVKLKILGSQTCDHW